MKRVKAGNENLILPLIGVAMWKTTLQYSSCLSSSQQTAFQMFHISFPTLLFNLAFKVQSME